MMTIDEPRHRLTRRSFLVGAAFALTSAAAYAAMPRRSEHRLARQKLSALIPSMIGSWRFTTTAGVIVPSDEGPVDGYDQVLTRTYQAAGLPDVMLLIAYGSTQGGSLQLHRPETCYPGQGFKISGFADVSLHPSARETVPARTFTASRDDRVERLLYWTRIADSFPRNTAEEYRAIIGSVVRGVVPDGILVRVSAVGSDVAASDRAVAAFAAALIDAPKAARSILVGDVMASALARMGAVGSK